ncbi:MAG: hypothetical protein M3322_05495 [Actinomycetota bacterium]|nr:hypothetical protein [Actinomycetota bacterium]
MAETEKARPEPIEEPGSLYAVLDRTAKGEVDPELRISLLVVGGAPSQRYRFDFAASGSGEVSAELACDLSNRRGKAEGRKLAEGQFAALARAILASGVLEAPAEPPRFLPDTVVGILELSDGTSRRRWYFAADPEQARSQQAEPPRAVADAADAIYAVAGRLMRKRSVKP